MSDQSSKSPTGRQWVRWQRAHGFFQDWLAAVDRPQLDRWLAKTLRADRKLGKKDRKWYADRIFAAVRVISLADHVWSRLPTQNQKPGAGLYLHLAAWLQDLDCSCPMDDAEEAQWTNVTQAVEDLRDQASNEESSDYLSAQLTLAGIPISFLPHLEERMQSSHWNLKTVAQFLNKQGTRPPLWLRLNRLDALQDVSEELTANGFQISPDPNNPWAIAASGTRGIYEFDAYKKGLIEIQDLASQQIGLATKATAGEYIWDACAGGGGKTIQMGTLMGGKGAIYASDVRSYKLQEVKRRAKAAGLQHVRPFPCDALAALSFPKEVEKRQGFDAVLVDAPCTASGTWRRNPDACLRLDSSGIVQLTELQMGILSNASRAVKPGGRLVYGTCSWLVAENEKVVQKFLQNSPKFKLVKMRLWGCPETDADTTFTAEFQHQES